MDVDRADGRRAIAATPLVGFALGVIVAAIVWAGVETGLPAAVAGLIGVGAHAVLTRGMHLDGLADVADGLGCYGDAERARTVMKSGSAGPFGVAALALSLSIQGLALGELVERGRVLAIVAAVFAARCAVVAACRRSVPAAGHSGFGSLVAASQSRVTVALWTAAALLAGAAAVPDRWYHGVLAVAAASAVGAAFTRHCVRRFGGLVGDVLGAVIEITTGVVLVLCLLVP